MISRKGFRKQNTFNQIEVQRKEPTIRKNQLLPLLMQTVSQNETSRNYPYLLTLNSI